MAVEVGSAYMTIVPSAKNFAGNLQKELGGDLETAGKDGGSRFGGGIVSGIKSIATPVAALFAADKVVGFLSDSISEAREAQKVGAQTEQVIRSTGAAAGVTAQQIGDLATAISNKTGIDDEQIQASENMLLTFTNVKNQVGQGNDVFNQATQTITDMSVALGQDGKSSAIQLGKALNDPIQGITALQRVGVSFTDQQKEQIKTMVKSGDTLGAQKLILGELNKEFGGSAEAQATAGEKAATAFKNLQEQVGTALLPVLDAAAGFLSDTLIPAVSGLFSSVQDGSNGPLKALIDVFGQVKDTAALFFAVLTGSDSDAGAALDWAPQVVTAADTVQAVLSNVAQIITTVVTPALAQIGQFILTDVVPRVMSIVGAVQSFLTVAIPIVQQFVDGMRARIEPLLPQIQAIFGTIGQIITAEMELVQAVIERITAVISFVWTNWGAGILNYIAAVWSAIIGVVGPALAVIQSVIKTVTSLIRGDWAGVWDGIQGIVSNAWELIKSIVSGALGIIEAAMSLAWSVIRTGVSAAWDAIKSTVSNKIGEVVDSVSGLRDRLVGALSSAGSWLVETGKSIVQGLIDGVKRMGATLVNAIIDLIPGPVQAVVRSALGIASPSKVMRQLGVYTVQGFVDGLTAGPSVGAAMSNLVRIPNVSYDISPSGDSANSGTGRLAPVVNFNAPVGWNPDEVAQRIATRQRDADALTGLDLVIA